MRQLTVFFALLAALAVSGLPALGAGGGSSDGAGGQVVPGRFLVTLADGVNAAEVASEYGRHGADVQFVYGSALNGFAGRMSDAATARARGDGRVVQVEPDRVVTVEDVQTGATWGIDRIDQRTRPLSTTYEYVSSAGTDVNVYVLDTGIRSHTEFGTRLVHGFDAIDGALPADDCHGHGTHVAGTAGGTVYGVAKAVTLVAVRVLDCSGSGTWSQVIAGIDWVTGQAPLTAGPDVANMSLSGGASSTVDAAVRTSIAAGVTYAVAAGNKSANACNYSPAREPAALTVGATTSSDSRASYSNYGKCLDLFAPGSSIVSASNMSSTATTTKSGTSMASPHVAGTAALFLGVHPDATPHEVSQAIVDGATTGVVTSRGRGSPDRLLYALLTTTIEPAPEPDPDNAPPVATITAASCSGASCSFSGSGTDPDGSVVSYAWSFGDGASGTGTTASHTYSGTGTYDVALTVTDDGGATGTDTTSVTCSWSGKGRKKTLSCA